MAVSIDPIFDLECHFFTDEAYDVYAKRNTYPKYDPETTLLTFVQKEGYADCACPQASVKDGLIKLGAERVEEFKSHGLTRAMISAAPGIESVLGEDGVKLCRHLNDVTYENMQAFPDFYYGSMVLPVSDIDAALDEMRRCAALGFVAWHTHSNYNTVERDTSLDDPEYEPLLEEAAKLGLLVYIHPTTPNFGRMLKYGYMFNAAALGFTVDTQITILGLIVRGVFDRIPGLKMMLGHLGEALPFTFERMDSRFSLPFLKGQYVNELNVSEYFGRNVFVSTSGNYSVDAFEMAKKLIGIENIVVGTDYPFETLDDNVEFINSLDLTPSEREQLCSGNAIRILGL